MEGEKEDQMEIVIFPGRTLVAINGKPIVNHQFNYNTIKVTFVDFTGIGKSTTLGKLVQGS